MRLTALALTTLVLATTALAAAPAAEAAPPCWYTPLDDKPECVTEYVAGICVYGYNPDCLIYNPCNPWYCDPWWP